jgi:uncharacterized protein YukE
MKWLKPHFRNFIVVALLIVGVKYTQEFQDWYKLLRYHAPPQIAKLATITTMTDTGRRLFYVNQPQIETQKSSENLCKTAEHTVVLGCYVSGKGIFIQSVPDPRLEGVMEVTAAHEMLHAVYHRMSLVEQNHINEQLQLVFGKIDNPRIKDLIDTYKEQDPASVNSELHSILPTEVRNLTPELEAHYHKYFIDRQKIVELSEKYEGVFTTLRNRAREISSQLAGRKFAMGQLAEQVDREAAAVEKERVDLQNSIGSNLQGDYSNRVAQFNDRVRNYNQIVAELRQQTDTYNQMVTEHNSLALEEKSLVESLENKPAQQSAR